MLEQDNHTFFHSTAWARVLSESYNYKALYFSIIKNGQLKALIPLMEVNSFITGKRAVSLPFTDYCRPLFSDPDDLEAITDHIIRHGQKAGWKTIEFRGEPFSRENAAATPLQIIATTASNATDSLEHRALALLENATGPMTRTAIRQHLNVNNQRLGETLTHLDKQALAMKTSKGWNPPDNH